MKKQNLEVPTEPAFDYRNIKSFEDACQKEGVTTDLPQLTDGCQELLKPIVSIYKLMVIFKAVNHDWTPDWNNNNQPKWSPWFWVGSSGAGFSFSNAHYGCGDSDLGSRLCCETSDQLRYIMDTFEEEFKEFMLYR